jgi:hypothetical protein
MSQCVEAHVAQKGMRMRDTPEFLIVTHSLFFLETRHKLLINVRVTVALIIADLLDFAQFRINGSLHMSDMCVV